MYELHGQTSRCIRDVILLIGILGVINVMAAPADLGWTSLNPSPWLLLPLLIGGRYGIGPGVGAGLAACLGIVLLQAHALGEPAPAFAQQHAYFLTALALGGFLAGELNRLTRGQVLTLSEANEHLSDESVRFSAELELARETRQDLQRYLALLNAPMAALDEDLRKLIIGPPAHLLDGLLAMLHQHASITSAGLYRLEGTGLRRLAALHPTGVLGEKLVLEEVPLAARALEAQSIASVSDPLATTLNQPFLAAIPWKAREGMGVLLVQDLPLQAFSWANLAKIQLIITWVSALSQYRDDLHREGGMKFLKLEEFLPLVAQALEAEQVHHLPSIILRADYTRQADAGGNDISQKILQTLPPTALCTSLTDRGSLIILLPFSGETEAEALSQQIAKASPQVRLARYLVAGPLKLEDFWAHVTVS
ncbi:MAG: hypothetical protein JWO94_4012 [Verrucomicrobiaceae bacterium]|nr:hypothetical protein [Verrucomicrobiaceae bacterium]